MKTQNDNKDFDKGIQGEDGEEDGEDPDQASEEGDPDLIFKVKLDSPEPKGVKISKKNVCLVTIVRSEDLNKNEEAQKKLIEFFLNQRDPTWTQQFKNAVMLGPTLDEDDMMLQDIDLYEALYHFVAIGWKVFFAIIPPASVWNGAASFIISLALIGVVTFVVGEFATVLGCVLGIPESITAITLVALGTSLPDTFASMTAARNSKNADSAIGNITGSNAVNVYLGLGLPWAIASIYWQSNKNKDYEVKAGPLAFSVVVFLLVALVCFAVLLARRFVSSSKILNLSKHIFHLVCWSRAWRFSGWKICIRLFPVWFMGHLYFDVYPPGIRCHIRKRKRMNRMNPKKCKDHEQHYWKMNIF